MMETLLVFRVGDMLLGVDSDRVARVQRVPVMTDVPLGQGALKGIAVIDGRIVPVLDMGGLVGTDPVDMEKPSARLVVVQAGSDSLGFVVDAIEQTVEFEEGALAPADEALNWVEGIYTLGEAPVQVVRPEALINRTLLASHQPFHVPIPLPAGVQQDVAESRAGGEETILFLHFQLGDEHFAMPTEQVGELLKVPDYFTPLTGAPMPPVLGVSALRGEMVTVLDLGAHLGFGAFHRSDQARLIVLTDGTQQLAVAVPQVHEVMEVPEGAIRSVRTPEQDGGVLPVSGVFRDEKRQIVSILGSAALNALLAQFALTETHRQMEQQTGGSEQMVELAVFRIGDEAYALDIEQVQEIIKLQPITPIPEPPQYVEGIINLRGKVIPVINLPVRLGFTFEPTERSKIVVGLYEGNQVGFLVDDVDEILYVDAADCAFSDDPDSLIHATVTLDGGKRVILWLRLQKVLEGIRFSGLQG